MLRTLTLALTLTLTVRAADWPQWRGPAFNGTSPDKGLPAEWTDANIKWQTPLPGFSGATPVVWGDTIFLTSPDANKNLLLFCLDRKDGKVRWQKEVVTGGNMEVGRGNMCSPSPVTDGKTVYVLFGTGDLAAFDFSGKPLWQRNLGADYGKFAIMWTYGSSPLLYAGKLYVQVLQRSPVPHDYPGIVQSDKASDMDRESYLLAVDPATGKTLWKHVRPTEARMESRESYASPIPHEAGGKKQLLLVGGDYLSGHDPETGEELWHATGLNPKGGEWMRVVSSPVSADGIAIACGPKKEPIIAFRTDGKGDVTTSALAWKFDEKKTPDVCTPAYADGKLFVLDGDSRTLTALDAKSGAKLWQGSLGHSDTVRSSPTVADGKIYTISEAGKVVVCDATGPDFKILSSSAFEHAEPTRSSIVVASGQLFFRLADRLVCVGK